MAILPSSFGVQDGLELIQLNILRTGQQAGLPGWSLANDPVVRTQLAYGGEVVRDTGYRLRTLTLRLRFPSMLHLEGLRLYEGFTGTLTLRGTSYPGTILHQVTDELWMPGGRVECSARFSRRWVSP